MTKKYTKVNLSYYIVVLHHGNIQQRLEMLCTWHAEQNSFDTPEIGCCRQFVVEMGKDAYVTACSIFHDFFFKANPASHRDTQCESAPYSEKRLQKKVDQLLTRLVCT